MPLPQLLQRRTSTQPRCPRYVTEWDGQGGNCYSIWEISTWLFTEVLDGLNGEEGWQSTTAPPEESRLSSPCLRSQYPDHLSKGSRSHLALTPPPGSQAIREVPPLSSLHLESSGKTDTDCVHHRISLYISLCVCRGGGEPEVVFGRHGFKSRKHTYQ